MSEKWTKVDEELQNSDDDCEGANYHDRVGLAGAIFTDIKKYIEKKNHLNVAKAIRKALEP